MNKEEKAAEKWAKNHVMGFTDIGIKAFLAGVKWQKREAKKHV